MYWQGVRIVYLCLVAVLVATVATAEDGGRIVNGQITSIDKVPYAVQLKDNWGRFICGGTLVTPLTVVTAAHCFINVNVSKVKVVAGATRLSETGVQRSVAKYFIHPKFEKDMAGTHDAAVLILDKPVDGPIAKTIPLSRRSIDGDTTIQVSGWGLTSETAASTSNQLRTVFVPTLSQDKCIQHYGANRISNTMMCASGPDKKDSCTGDSGGPAVANNELVGIVSWGDGCGRADKPGVYTRVDEVLPFLTENIVE